MSEAPSKTNANMNTAKGNVKDTVGSTIGNEQMQAEGKATAAAGNTEHEAATTAEYLTGLKDKVVGTVQSTFNSVTGNTAGHVEGEARKTGGQAKMDMNSESK